MADDYIDIENNKLIDSETRLRLVTHLAELIGLKADDVNILLFMALGDVRETATKPEMLKHIKLPRVTAKYNTKRLRELCSMMADRMKELDQYGILNTTAKEVMKKSRNGEYITLFGMEILPYVYVNTWKMLSYKQDYIVSTLMGLKEALDTTIEFLGIEKVD